MNKRILLLSTAQLYGGAEMYYVKLANLLRERYEVAAIVADSQLYEHLLAHDIPTKLLPHNVGAGAVSRYREAATYLVRAIRSFRPNCVHLNGQAESYLSFIPAVFGIPMVSTRHVTFEEYAPAFKRFLVAWNLRKIKRTVCVSSALKQQGARVVDERRLVVISNWLDPLPDALPYIPRREGEAFRLLHVGRLVRDKGIFDLIEAVRLIGNVSLAMVGDGAHSEEAYLRASGLPITFHGFQKDCAQFYRGAHLLIFPSYQEGQGQVPIEAMAYGLPCLLSDIPVSRETADQGRAAVLFQCGNVGDLVEKIVALRNDPQRLISLSEYGVKSVHRLYTSERARQQYFKVFDDAMEEP